MEIELGKSLDCQYGLWFYCCSYLWVSCPSLRSLDYYCPYLDLAIWRQEVSTKFSQFGLHLTRYQYTEIRCRSFCLSWIYLHIALHLLFAGRNSSVGIATRYGLDDLWIESRWGRVFPHLFRPALGPTQLAVQWVPGLSRGKNGRGVALTTCPI
jgi:hypothetical protein